MTIFSGNFQLPWWGYLIFVLALTHLTIISVTVYLHRYMAHRALELHPIISHFFRFWLWLTTGIVTREWVAVHRKHHAMVETEDDPHSPQVVGINKVLWEGAELYRKETANDQTLDQYGHHCPDDWIERRLYSHHSYIGISLMLLLNIYLFGVIGITLWAVQMIWIPFFAAGIINGVGHWAGYRNFEPHDASTNIVPWGILIGGEELHNNHHAFASSARFSCKRWELDLGWNYITLMRFLGLARVKKVAPVLKFNRNKTDIDLDTVRAVISYRFHIMSAYAKQVVSEAYKIEKSRTNDRIGKKLLKRGKRLITVADNRLCDMRRQYLHDLLENCPTMETVYRFKQELQTLWTAKRLSHEQLIERLQNWCQEAEASGIASLEEFARAIRGYTLQPVPV